MTTREMLINEAHRADLLREAETMRQNQSYRLPAPTLRSRIAVAFIELGDALLRHAPEPPANFEPNPVR